jgi:hypothetical protein
MELDEVSLVGAGATTGAGCSTGAGATTGAGAGAGAGAAAVVVSVLLVPDDMACGAAAGAVDWELVLPARASALSAGAEPRLPLVRGLEPTPAVPLVEVPLVGAADDEDE